MFNDPIAAAKFAELQRQFGFKVCIETGTEFGVGSMGISRLCTCATIEVSPMKRAQAVLRWLEAGYAVRQNKYKEHSPYLKADIHLHTYPIYSWLGDSSLLLREILLYAYRDAMLCFYLDAHVSDDPGAPCPLLAELQVIADFELSDAVIIIHDCQVPGHPELGFDSYEGKPINYELVREALARINPNYTISYNNHAEGNLRGILYATP